MGSVISEHRFRCRTRPSTRKIMSNVLTTYMKHGVISLSSHRSPRWWLFDLVYIDCPVCYHFSFFIVIFAHIETAEPDFTSYSGIMSLIPRIAPIPLLPSRWSILSTFRKMEFGLFLEQKCFLYTFKLNDMVQSWLSLSKLRFRAFSTYFRKCFRIIVRHFEFFVCLSLVWIMTSLTRFAIVICMSFLSCDDIDLVFISRTLYANISFILIIYFSTNGMLSQWI